VLKLTWTPRPDQLQMLRLEGELTGPWVEEVRQAFGGATVTSSCVRLDAAAVTFVDAVGVALLRELIGRGVEIAACSPFVAELLKWEKR
jgi:ABC-type transporter Mla MlaB component